MMTLALQDLKDVFYQTLHVALGVWMGAQDSQYVCSSFSLEHSAVLRGYNNRTRAAFLEEAQSYTFHSAHAQ